MNALDRYMTKRHLVNSLITSDKEKVAGRFDTAVRLGGKGLEYLKRLKNPPAPKPLPGPTGPVPIKGVPAPYDKLLGNMTHTIKSDKSVDHIARGLTPAQRKLMGKHEGQLSGMLRHPGSDPNMRDFTSMANRPPSFLAATRRLPANARLVGQENKALKVLNDPNFSSYPTMGWPRADSGAPGVKGLSDLLGSAIEGGKSAGGFRMPSGSVRNIRLGKPTDAQRVGMSGAIRDLRRSTVRDVAKGTVLPAAGTAAAGIGANEAKKAIQQQLKNKANAAAQKITQTPMSQPGPPVPTR